MITLADEFDEKFGSGLAAMFLGAAGSLELPGGGYYVRRGDVRGPAYPKGHNLGVERGPMDLRESQGVEKNVGEGGPESPESARNRSLITTEKTVELPSPPSPVPSLSAKTERGRS